MKESSMLVHICCSVDSHFFLQKLQKLYPNERLVGFFYDPNIHPYSEYQLRLLDVKRSCKKLGIELLEGEYNFEGWIRAVRGLEAEPEKGKRCSVCFDNRLEESAKKAFEIGEKSITTTLLTSPKKSLEQLTQALQAIVEQYGLEVVAPDFRKNGGTQEQFALAKKDMLYHQDYCGCIFALEKQRSQQKRFADELSTPLRPRLLPSSIEERIALYEKVLEAEERSEPFTLVREKFLNYRLLRGYIRNAQKEVIPSYILFYSVCKREYVKTSLVRLSEDEGIGSKEEIRFISLAYANRVLKTSYKTVKEMLFSPPSVEEEMTLRKEIFSSFVPSLSPILILDALEEGSYELSLWQETYTDIRENLVLIG